MTVDGLARFAAAGFELELDARVQGSGQQQRALGYNRSVAVWSQRTINESAAVAAYLATTIEE